MPLSTTRPEGEEEDDRDDDDPAGRPRAGAALLTSTNLYGCGCQGIAYQYVQAAKGLCGGAEHIYSPRGGARRTPSRLHSHLSVHMYNLEEPKELQAED